ncbi:MAG: class A beta-lactamase [Parafilimonas terrae]|nr:class A beta-lactamase [Parafilimonas terrae]
MLSLTRRAAWTGLLASAASPRLALAGPVDEARWRSFEERTGGRLGVSVGEPGTTLLAWRADERFPFCSTFKVLSTASILARVDAGIERLDRIVMVREADLLSYAPVARKAVEAGNGTGRMTLEEVCAAAMIWSDNTAANLQLGLMGGPAGLTRWVRTLGDDVTRSDRTEPTLNTALPGDSRDTTSPAAMRGALAQILLGSALAPPSRTRLEGWMVAAQTGFKRLRAGLPPDWTVGDKTGSGDNGTVNTVAILRPPGRPPLLATVYLTGATAPAATCEAVHAEVGRLIAAAVAG